MTKRDFINLAASLYRLKPNDGDKSVNDIKMDQWRKTVLEMADFCADQNDNFNRQRFLTACGLT